jgi:predicted component of type VI protein secretion system
MVGDDEVPGDQANWLIVDNQRVSKKHATIRWDAEAKAFKLKCHGRNGVDCNRESGWGRVRGTHWRDV